MGNQISDSDQNIQSSSRDLTDSTSIIQKKSKVNFWMISTIVLLLLVLSISAIFYLTMIQSNKLRSVLLPSVPADKNIAITTPTSTPSVSIKIPSNEMDTVLYKVKLSQKAGFIKPQENLQEVIEKLINIPTTQTVNNPKQTPIKLIAFDIRETEPFAADLDGKSRKWNASYYMLVENYKIDVGRIYEDENLALEVTRTDQALTPYIKDNDFCKVDSECTVRFNYCSYGSYNYYQSFADVWGCGPPSDSETKNEDGSYYNFGFFDEKMGCETDVKYSASRCINNQCVGQNRVVSCVGK